jgi:hypothetical protein
LLLQDRFDFLRESILAVWNQPHDRHAVAVVHTMMYYFAVIAGNRRAADRRYKQRAKHRTVSGRISRDEESQCNEVAAPQRASDHDIFKEIARRLAKERGVECNFGDDEWQATLTREIEDPVLEISISCPARDCDETIRVPRAEFESVARTVSEE